MFNRFSLNKKFKCIKFLLISLYLKKNNIKSLKDNKNYLIITNFDNFTFGMENTIHIIGYSRNSIIPEKFFISGVRLKKV